MAWIKVSEPFFGAVFRLWLPLAWSWQAAVANPNRQERRPIT
jgi:hypothetical protein